MSSHKLVVASNAMGNIVISPFSAQLAMTSVMAGARGNTLVQFESVFNDSLDKLLFILKGISGICITNQVFMQTGYDILPMFIAALAQRFVQFSTVNFSDNVEDAYSQINGDIKLACGISDMFNIDSANPLTRLVIVNTLRLKMGWHIPFPVNNTRPGKFNSSNGKITRDFMNFKGSSEFGIYVDNNYQAVALFLEDTRFHVELLIKKDGTLPSPDDYSKYLCMPPGELDEYRIHVPKFMLDSTINIGTLLKNLGITDAFDETVSNFSGISSNPDGLVVSNIAQAVHIEFNEWGLDASTCTAVEIATRCACENIWFNKPFGFRVCYHTEDYPEVVLFDGCFDG